MVQVHSKLSEVVLPIMLIWHWISYPEEGILFLRAWICRPIHAFTPFALERGQHFLAVLVLINLA